MKDTITETSLISMIVSLWEGWADRIEPASGSSVGFPDLVLFDKAVGSIPFEVKVGFEKTLGVISPVGDGMRPAQIRWHAMFAREGGVSGVLIGNPDGIYIVPGRDANLINHGLSVIENNIMLVASPQIRSRFKPLLCGWIKQEKAHASSCA